MASFKCPFCREVSRVNEDTHRMHRVEFNNAYGEGYTTASTIIDNDRFDIDFYRCPSCDKYTVKATGGYAGQFEGTELWLEPRARMPSIMADMPVEVFRDYEEACAILSSSPKASATMSRRCLQGMVRDFWGAKKGNLHEEIEALRGKIDEELVETLLAFKSIANIGAHPNKNADINLLLDVEPNEAELLIEMIEFLHEDWYAARKNKAGLFSRLQDIKSSKDRAKGQSSSSDANS